jgi:hypothetical protein
MTKVLFTIVILSCTVNAFANDESFKKVNLQNSFNTLSPVSVYTKTAFARSEKQPLCRACCTISATNANGTQSVTGSACARNSDCDVAASSACTAARINALKAAYQ